MLGHWFLLLRNLTPAGLIIAIALDVFNRDQLKPWLKSYLPLLVFGFFASATVHFSLQNSLMALWIYLLVNLWFLAVNWRKIGLNLFILGAVSNFFVIIINGGRMPMPRGWAEENAAYQFATSKTLLPFLSDRIQIGNCMFSIGDIFMHTGILIFLVWQTCIFLKERLSILNKKEKAP